MTSRWGEMGLPIVLAACAPHARRAQADPEAAVAAQTVAGPTLHADADGGVLAMQRARGVGAAWSDVPPVAFRAALAPTDLSVGPWGAISADGTRLLVSDAFVATDLGSVAVHRGVSAPVVLGRLRPEVVLGTAPHEVVARLVELGRIELFAHLEGQAALVTEARTPEGAWRGTYHGSHVYYTSDRHEPTYDFSVQLDAEGTVTVGPP